MPVNDRQSDIFIKTVKSNTKLFILLYSSDVILLVITYACRRHFSYSAEVRQRVHKIDMFQSVSPSCVRYNKNMFILRNSNKTEWSPIRFVIIRVIQFRRKKNSQVMYGVSLRTKYPHHKI